MRSKKRIKSSKKKRIIIISIVSILLIILSVSGYIFYNSKALKVSFKKNIEININDKVYNTDYIKSIKNGSVISFKKALDTSKLGEQIINIKIKDYFNRKKNYKYKIKVVDKEAPIIEFKDKISITEGEKIDLLKDIKAKDNSNEEIKVTLSGEYDINKPGNYELYYVAKDSSNNEKKEKFTLEVKKKEVVINNDNGNEDTSFTTSKGYNGYTKNGITYINGVLIANKTYRLPSSYYPGGLTGETQSAFNKLKADASAIGFNLFIGSGFRSYNDQKYIYNNYVARDGQANADTYSARAGHSEHQTGLAFDVCDSNVSACITSEFDSTDQAKWISENCYKYGLIVRYPQGKSNETGYMYESWHLRYVGVDLATKLYNNGNWITLEDYFGITSKYS